MRVVINAIHHAEIRKLRFDPDVGQQVFDYGVRVRNTAISLAPVESGHYRASIFVMRKRGADPHTIVGATDFKAWWIEFGAYGRPVPFPARAPLRRALSRHRIKFVGVAK